MQSEMMNWIEFQLMRMMTLKSYKIRFLECDSDKTSMPSTSTSTSTGISKLNYQAELYIINTCTHSMDNERTILVNSFIAKFILNFQKSFKGYTENSTYYNWNSQKMQKRWCRKAICLSVLSKIQRSRINICKWLCEPR